MMLYSGTMDSRFPLPSFSATGKDDGDDRGMKTLLSKESSPRLARRCFLCEMWEQMIWCSMSFSTLRLALLNSTHHKKTRSKAEPNKKFLPLLKPIFTCNTIYGKLACKFMTFLLWCGCVRDGCWNRCMGITHSRPEVGIK